jgi:aspartate racemase
MGPEATIALMQRIHAATWAEDDADHIPLTVDMNTGVPSRIKHLIDGGGVDPGPVLAQMAAGLQVAGAEALVMPCNTAHHYAGWIEDAVSVPLLHMPKLTCARLASLVPAGSAIGVLASPATNQIGLFQSLLSEVGLSALYPEDEAPVLASIRRIKRSGPGAEDLSVLEQQSADLARRGAAAILIGCTEFSLLTARIVAPVRIVDALDVLVDATIDFAGARRR